MSTRREVLTGLIAALISIIILGGSLLLATTEVRSTVARQVSITPTLTSYPTQIILVTQRPGEATFTPIPSLAPSQTATSVAPTTCPPPAGWSAITVQPVDTLQSLAQTYNTTPEALAQSNCLVGNSLIPGTLLFVPGRPAPTSPPCGPPPGWVYYIVQPGDTLYSIGQAYGVNVAQLQSANCMGSSTLIRVGQKLYVPNVATITPSFTPTVHITQTPEPSHTWTPVPPSATPTDTDIPPSQTATSEPPSLTPTTSTLTPSMTPEIPTATATEATLTPTVTATSTVTATPSPTPSPTPTFTSTPEPPTATSTEWPTATTPPTSTPVPPSPTP